MLFCRDQCVLLERKILLLNPPTPLSLPMLRDGQIERLHASTWDTDGSLLA